MGGFQADLCEELYCCGGAEGLLTCTGLSPRHPHQEVCTVQLHWGPALESSWVMSSQGGNLVQVGMDRHPQRVSLRSRSIRKSLPGRWGIEPREAGSGPGGRS